MDAIRSIPVLLRVLVATVFAAMSVLHTPAMAMAGSDLPAGARHPAHLLAGHLSVSSFHHGAAHRDGHHHDGDHHDPRTPGHAHAQDGPPVPATPNLCFDCCTAVAPPAIAAPALIPVLLATLTPPPPKAASPFAPERIDPPPRLHA